ncbi:MAG: UDP-2,3-diacylglucosamine diphosphatase [Thermodesulfobacteriota bacterium]
MKIIFLGDAHLKGEGEAAETALIEFLQNLKEVDLLVILGDLFDFWTARNTVVERRYRDVLQALKDVKEHGVKIIYVEGNHDFSMGSFFIDELEASIVEGSMVQEFDGKRFYLTHGDTVGMTKGYRRWRRFLRSPLFSFLTTVVPSGVVWNIATRLSGKSRSYNTKGQQLDERLQEFAHDRIDGGVDIVVMGHSHMAGVHKIGHGTYANPGGWQGERSYLLYEKGKIEVKKY